MSRLPHLRASARAHPEMAAVTRLIVLGVAMWLLVVAAILFVAQLV